MGNALTIASENHEQFRQAILALRASHTAGRRREMAAVPGNRLAELKGRAVLVIGTPGAVFRERGQGLDWETQRSPRLAGGCSATRRLPRKWLPRRRRRNLGWRPHRACARNRATKGCHNHGLLATSGNGHTANLRRQERLFRCCLQALDLST